ncbi:MAG: hypothetical protein J2P37_23055 [Ktedonobacteraceae bacterium]|nr:hypothetical protein [Ktedonobacteraceae bacterium]
MNRLWRLPGKTKATNRWLIFGMLSLLLLMASAFLTPKVDAAARPVALVYRGPGGCEGCSEAVAKLLQSSKWNFDVRYVGPKERLKVSEATLKTATLYAQPGGDGSVDTAYAALKGDAKILKNFIKAGGHYLGFCMGGYLAGTDPGFNLLPGDTDQYIALRGASVKTEKDTVIKVNWRNKPRYMYFQDGPYFIVNKNATNVTVLARYTNGKIAAMVSSYGQGKVGVVGPHPEATSDWYKDYKLHDPDGFDADLGHDLIDTTMQ